MHVIWLCFCRCRYIFSLVTVVSGTGFIVAKLIYIRCFYGVRVVLPAKAQQILAQRYI